MPLGWIASVLRVSPGMDSELGGADGDVDQQAWGRDLAGILGQMGYKEFPYKWVEWYRNMET